MATQIQHHLSSSFFEDERSVGVLIVVNVGKANYRVLQTDRYPWS